MITSEENDTTTNNKLFKMKAIMATSLDSRHGIENILDGRINTFWISTGLFPQEIIVGLSTTVTLKSVILSTMKVAKVSLEVSSSHTKDFKSINTQEVNDGTIQTITFVIPPKINAKYLKFIFRKGYSEFITVHKLSVSGQPTSDNNDDKSSKIEKMDKKSSEDKILVRQNINTSSIRVNKSNSSVNNNSNTPSVNTSSNNLTTTTNNNTPTTTTIQKPRREKKFSHSSSHTSSTIEGNVKETSSASIPPISTDETSSKETKTTINKKKKEPK